MIKPSKNPQRRSPLHGLGRFLARLCNARDEVIRWARRQRRDRG